MGVFRITVLLFFALLASVISNDPSLPQDTSTTAQTSDSTTELMTTQADNFCSKIDQASQSIDQIISCTGGEIRLDKDPNLLDLSKFTQAQADQLLIENESSGSKRTRDFRHSLKLVESNLKYLNLAVYPADGFVSIFTFIGNTGLEEIILVGSRAKNKKITMTVKGNKNLKQETIEYIKKNFTLTPESYIQDFGECTPTLLSPALGSFANLAGCEYFKDELVIDDKTDLTNPVIPFTEIRGCLQIMNTKLTDISFMNKLKSIKCGKENLITGNKDLCLSSEETANLKRLYSKMTIEHNQKCKDKCTPDWAKKNKGDKNIVCGIIVGYLEITNITNVAELKYLENVEEIQGRLEVHHNNFTNYTILPKLRRVENLNKNEPAIFIHGNDHLVFIDLSSVKDISVPGALGDVLVVERNNKDVFKFSDKEVVRLRKFGGIRVPKEIKNVTAAPTSTTKEAVTSEPIKTDEEKAKEKIKEEKLKEKENVVATSNTVAIVCGVLGGILLLGIIIAIVLALYFLVYKKQKKKRALKKAQKVNQGESETPETPEANEEEKPKKIANDGKVLHQVVIEAQAQTVHQPQVDAKGNNEEIYEFRYMEAQEKDYFVEKRKLTKLNNGNRNRAFYGLSEDIKKIVGQSLAGAEDVKRKWNKIYVNQITYKTNTIGNMTAEQLVRMEIKAKFEPEEFIKVHMATTAKISYTVDVVEKAVDYFSKKCKHEKQLVKVDVLPCNVVGDINGSIWDLQHILKDTTVKHVFCGNYMNGTCTDLQALLLLFTFAASGKVILLRGVNEYGDRAKELLQNTLKDYFEKESEQTRTRLEGLFLEAFAKLPLGAVIGGRALAVHGGISESWYKTEKVNDLDQAFDQIPMPLPAKPDALVDKLVADLLYSDPSTVAFPVTEFGAGCYFNQSRLEKFLSDMQLDLLIKGRSDVGFEISMKNRLISLNGCFDKIFAKNGPQNVFRKEHVYSKTLERQQEMSPFGVLCLQKDGTISVEMHRHSYTKAEIDNILNYERKNKDAPVKQKYKEDLQQLKDAEYEKREKAVNKKLFKCEKMTEKKAELHYQNEMEQNIRIWIQDYRGSQMLLMGFHEAVQYYLHLLSNPQEKYAVELYGIYKYLKHGEYSPEKFDVYDEDHHYTTYPENRYVMHNSQEWGDNCGIVAKKKDSWKYVLHRRGYPKKEVKKGDLYYDFLHIVRRLVLTRNYNRGIYKEDDFIPGASYEIKDFCGIATNWIYPPRDGRARETILENTLRKADKEMKEKWAKEEEEVREAEREAARKAAQNMKKELPHWNPKKKNRKNRSTK